MATGTGAIVGTLAGPFGTASGAAIGITIDYLVSKGTELLQREEMVKDVRTLNTSTQKIYYIALQQELDRVIDVLIEDAMQLIPKIIVK